MAPSAVRGRVVDDDGAPLPHLTVEIRDPGRPGDPLDAALTDADGAYALACPPRRRLLGAPTSRRIALRILDRARIRLLHELPLDVPPDARLDAPDVVLPRPLVAGWRVPDGRGAPWPLTRGNRVDLLVDGERTFAAVRDAARRARRSLEIQQLLFEPDFPAAFDDDAPRVLMDELQRAAARGVDVRILLNENAILPDDFDEAARAASARAGVRAPRVRRYPLALHILHAKSLIRDAEECILVGPPFERRWWDTRAHDVHDPRRGPGHPTHDVSARLVGPAVAQVRDLFARLWNERCDETGEPWDRIPRAAHDPAAPPTLAAPHAPHDGGTPDPAHDVAIQFALTAPPGVLGRHDGATGILEAYQRALAKAERFVYLETQYFTSDAITDALQAALRANPDLEAILVVNEHMDVPTYDQWQRRRLKTLDWPRHERLGVHSLWAHTPPGPDARPAVRPIYVHSKIAIVDDAWATLGSANLDGYSLDAGKELFLHETRSLEMNAILLDGIDDAPRSGIARRLRTTLWSEAIGGRPDDHAEPPPEGWVAWWNERTRANLDALARGEAPPHGLALPHGARLPPTVARPAKLGRMPA